jgi:hypothetical protein
MNDGDHRADRDGIDPARRTVPSSTGHPTADQVALSRSGGLEPRDAAAIRAHVRSCPRCRAVEAKLLELRRILAHRADGKMPAKIATRIDQALIAEAVQGMGVGQWPPAPRSASRYS